MDSIGEGKLTVTIGTKTQHVAGYLRSFLFPPERLRSPVSMLSGGERNRLLLARLFAQPANLLVLDEPTNDLDAETLELLEELLIEFQGTLLLVSHDRAFLDNVVTGTLVFEGEGRVSEYTGGYSDWLRYRARPIVEPVRVARTPDATPVQAPTAAPPLTRRKRSYKEQREIEALPATIEALEAEQATLQQALTGPEFYRKATDEISATRRRLEEISRSLADCYARWEALES